MSVPVSQDEIADRLLQIIRVIGWMDWLRWHKHEQVSYLATLAPFMKLNDDKKLLTHWLCYITDRMRPVIQVWKLGGTIFSELVSDYHQKEIQNNDDFIAMLKQKGGYVQKPKSGKIDTFVSKQKYTGDNGPERYFYAPRYGEDFLSILRTLMILFEYNKSVISYLRSMKSLWYNKDDELGRLAFLLYVLSYENINDGLHDLSRKGQRKLIKDVTQQLSRIKGIKDTFEKEYTRWSKHKRYHKRLWAALRDYFKNTLFSGYFLQKMQLAPRREQLLDQLELPGDVWNERFSDRLLKPLLSTLQYNGLSVYVKKSPITTRRLFNWLKQEGVDLEAYYPEQFDISYSFTSRMCENQFWQVCPFGENGSQYICLGERKDELKFCPVILTTCGYIAECNPKGCPIVEGVGKGLCQSCKGNIET